MSEIKYLVYKITHLSSSTVGVFSSKVGHSDDDSAGPVLEVRVVFQVIYAHFAFIQHLRPKEYKNELLKKEQRL